MAEPSPPAELSLTEQIARLPVGGTYSVSALLHHDINSVDHIKARSEELRNSIQTAAKRAGLRKGQQYRTDFGSFRTSDFNLMITAAATRLS